jgi:hypothetical protein
MTAQDYDDRDVEFTGVLAQPLKPGEDPSLKLPKLYEALGVETPEAAVLALARMVKRLEGFRRPPPLRRKRKTRGRPNLLSLVLEARSGPDIRLPDFVVADLEDRLIGRMETLLAAAKECGRSMKVLDAAFRAMEEEEADGHFNHFHLDDSISREKREAFAASAASLFTHRTKRREKHAAARETQRAQIGQEVQHLWPRILQEMTDRVSTEAAERVAAGESAEEVLADVPRRALEIAKDIVQHRWPV